MDLGAKGSSFKSQIGIIYIQNQTPGYHNSWFGLSEFSYKISHLASYPWKTEVTILSIAPLFPAVGHVDHELLVQGAVTSCLIRMAGPSLFFLQLWTAPQSSSGSRTACPERLCTFCSQRFSRQHWIQSWVTQCDLTAAPALNRRWPPEVPSTLNFPVIL